MNESYELEMVTSRTIANTGGIGRGNVGAIALEKFLIVIDSSMYVTTAEQFRAKLESKFSLPVKYLIITHFHADHIFGMKVYKDIPMISGMQVSDNLQRDDVSKQYKEYIIELEKKDPLGKGIEFILPNVLFTDTIVIKDDDIHIEVFNTGGHTSGTSFIHVPSEKVVFAGDLIFENMFPYAGDSSCDPEKWIVALEEMRVLDPEFIIPGHGPLMKGAETLDRHIEFLKELKLSIKDALRKDLPPEEVKVPTTFENIDPELKSLTVNHWLDFYRT